MALADPFFAEREAAPAAAAPRPATGRQLRLVALIAFLFGVPFLGKAVQQDDWAYLAVSKLVEEHGIFGVQEQTTHYQGGSISAARGMLHGPVWPYLMLVAHQTGGAVVVVGHLISVLFLVLLAVASASLAARLGAPAVPTGLLVALSPVPLVLSGGLMTDLPMTALFVSALALYVRGLQESSFPTLIAAGLVGALTELTRYHGLAILPMFAVTPLLLGRHSWRHLTPLYIAVLAYAGWLYLSFRATSQAA